MQPVKSMEPVSSSTSATAAFVAKPASLGASSTPLPTKPPQPSLLQTTTKLPSQSSINAASNALLSNVRPAPRSQPAQLGQPQPQQVSPQRSNPSAPAAQSSAPLPSISAILSSTSKAGFARVSSSNQGLSVMTSSQGTIVTSSTSKLNLQPSPKPVQQQQTYYNTSTTLNSNPGVVSGVVVSLSNTMGSRQGYVNQNNVQQAVVQKTYNPQQQQITSNNMGFQRQTMNNTMYQNQGYSTQQQATQQQHQQMQTVRMTNNQMIQQPSMGYANQMPKQQSVIVQQFNHSPQQQQQQSYNKPVIISSPSIAQHQQQQQLLQQRQQQEMMHQQQTQYKYTSYGLQK